MKYQLTENKEMTKGHDVFISKDKIIKMFKDMGENKEITGFFYPIKKLK